MPEILRKVSIEFWNSISIDKLTAVMKAYIPKPSPCPIPVNMPLARLPDIVFRITRTKDGPGDIAPSVRARDNASHCVTFIVIVLLLFSVCYIFGLKQYLGANSSIYVVVCKFIN